MAKTKAEIARTTYREQDEPVIRGCATCVDLATGPWDEHEPHRWCEITIEGVSLNGICDCCKEAP